MSKPRQDVPTPRGWTGGSDDFTVSRQDRSYRKFTGEDGGTVYDPGCDYFGPTDQEEGY